jgi:hypothetical protein
VFVFAAVIVGNGCKRQKLFHVVQVKLSLRMWPWLAPECWSRHEQTHATSAGEHTGEDLVLL